MSLSIENTRFFEIEGKTFAAGNRTFTLNEPDQKAESALVIPFGVKTSSFSETQVLSVKIEGEKLEELKKFEQELLAKLNLNCPDFIAGTQKHYSIIKQSRDECMLNFKINPETTWSFFDVKKGTFSKSKIDQALPGSKVFVDFAIGHPWKMDINGKVCFGFSLRAIDVVICSTMTKTPKILKRKTIKDKMTELLKKKTKFMEHKEE